MDLSKEKLINKLIQYDTASFRRFGLRESGRLAHEPPKFRSNLINIYNKLNKKDIRNLLIVKRATKVKWLWYPHENIQNHEKTN